MGRPFQEEGPDSHQNLLIRTAGKQGGVPGLGRDCEVLCLQLSQLIPDYFGPFIKMAASPCSTNTDSRKV